MIFLTQSTQCILQSEFTEKGFMKTENFEDNMLLLFSFTPDKIATQVKSTSQMSHEYKGPNCRDLNQLRWLLFACHVTVTVAISGLCCKSPLLDSTEAILAHSVSDYTSNSNVPWQVGLIIDTPQCTALSTLATSALVMRRYWIEEIGWEVCVWEKADFNATSSSHMAGDWLTSESLYMQS